MLILMHSLFLLGRSQRRKNSRRINHGAALIVETEVAVLVSAQLPGATGASHRNPEAKKPALIILSRSVAITNALVPIGTSLMEVMIVSPALNMNIEEREVVATTPQTM